MFENKGGRYFWFSKYLIKHGYEPIIACANVIHNSSEFIDTRNKKYIIKEVDNIPFVFIKTITATGNGIKRFINMFQFYYNLFPVSKEIVRIFGRPDVILASSPHPLVMLAGIKIAQKLKIPCVCDILDLWPEAIFAFYNLNQNSVLGKLLVAGEHFIYKKADALIFSKEGEIDYIREKKWDIENGGDIDIRRAYFITIGVDVHDFNSNKKNMILDDEDLLSDDFKIIYAGAIRPVNNVDKIVETAACLKNYDDIKFLIYGDGFQREMLENKIKELGLLNISFKGKVNKQYIPYILNKSSVNLLNYKQTDYYLKRGDSSNKLFEYMAAGKPIISTVKMGYSLIERYNCGIEIENATPAQIANAILTVKTMSKDEYERLGYNASQGAKDIDVKILTKKIISVLENI